MNNYQSTIEFLRHFKGRHWLQTFDDKKLGRKELVDWRYATDHEDDECKISAAEILIGTSGHIFSNLNKQEAGVYFCVNELKEFDDRPNRSATNISNIRAFFVDLDGAPLQPVMDCALRPSLIVQTSADRWQAYWLLKEPIAADRALFRDIQHAIAARFNGDKAVNDLCRVMRLPGFYNMKREPFMVTWSSPSKNWEVKEYTLEEIKNEFIKHDAAAGNGSSRAVSDRISNRSSNVLSAAEIVQLKIDEGIGNAWDCELTDPALLRGALLAISSDDYSTWINVGIALRGAAYNGDITEELAEEFWHAWSSLNGDYDEVESARKWEGFNVTGERGIGSIFHMAKEYGWKGERRNFWTAEEAAEAIMKDFA